jgi:Fur family zinc uptake transcriptional regulator/Fur family ferric uptake transcriptional regulator
LPFDRLKRGGYKITPQRQEIIKCFGSGGKHYSAEEVHRKISRRFPNISLDTVYRNLNILKQLGIISALNFTDGKSRYELAGEDRHHHHLVCLKCGGSQEVEFCPLNFLDSTLLREKDFTVERHSFEIYGYCSRCVKAR